MISNVMQTYWAHVSEWDCWVRNHFWKGCKCVVGCLHSSQSLLLSPYQWQGDYMGWECAR